MCSELNDGAPTILQLRAIESLLAQLETVGVKDTLLLGPIPRTVLLKLLIFFKATCLVPKHLCGLI